MSVRFALNGRGPRGVVVSATMTFTRLPRFLALFLLVGLARVERAAACDCGGNPPTIDETFAAAEVVAEGDVSEVRKNSVVIVVEVLHKGPSSLRGQPPRELGCARRRDVTPSGRPLVIEVRNEGGSCGYGFTVRDHVLVYAGEAEGRLYVRQCAATRVVTGAAARAESRRWCKH